MIDDFNGMCDKLFGILLDSYQMQDWNMSWEEFLNEAEKEIINFFKSVDKILDE